jgi:hypothetical protein
MLWGLFFLLVKTELLCSKSQKWRNKTPGQAAAAAHNFLDSPTRYHDITLHTLTLSVNNKVTARLRFFLSRSLCGRHWVNLPAAHRPGVLRKKIGGLSLSSASAGNSLTWGFSPKKVFPVSLSRQPSRPPRQLRLSLDLVLCTMQIWRREERKWVVAAARGPRECVWVTKAALSLHLRADPQNDIQNTHRNLAHVFGFCGGLN